MSDSEDSIEGMNNYEDTTDPKTEEYLQNVRNKVRDWKTREMEKNTNQKTNAKSLDSLRKYVATSAALYYDLLNFLTTSKNNEKNMGDTLYVNIIAAIGSPSSITSHLRTLLQHFLQRDLVELPFTMEPKIINTYAKNGIKSQTEFPEEE